MLLISSDRDAPGTQFDSNSKVIRESKIHAFSGGGHRCAPASRLATTPACGSCRLSTLPPPASELTPPACEAPASRLGLRTKLTPTSRLAPHSSRLRRELRRPAKRSSRLPHASSLSQAAEAAAWGRRLPGAGSWICRQAGVWPQRIANFSSGCSLQ